MELQCINANITTHFKKCFHREVLTAGQPSVSGHIDDHCDVASELREVN